MRAAAIALLAASCASVQVPVGQPPAALLALLADAHGAAGSATFERRRARIVIESDDLAFEGEGVAVVSRLGAPRLALQLLPPVGGKVFDLRVRAAADGALQLRGDWPQAARTVDVDLARGDAPRGLELFLAATSLEPLGPPDPERVIGARRAAQGWYVALRPRLPGTEVIARLDARGAVASRRYRYRGVAWREDVGPDARTVRGRGVTVRVLGERSEPLDAAPDALFETGAGAR